MTDTMQDDLSVLKAYVERRADGDFAELVDRHLGMVFATALRRVGGDAHLAQDVAQSVFIDLARKAPALQHVRVLAGWLYTSTLYAAAKTVRQEQRRRRREQEAHVMQELNHDSTSDADWARLRPVLDDALRSLNTRDRDAILLRFFHAQGFAAIGATLSLSENAARMRVDRALDKLRGQLARRGITSTLGALGTTLAAHAAATPPVALASSITTTALASASGAGALTTLLNVFAMTKIQITLTALVATAGVTGIVQQQVEQARLRTVTAADAAVVRDMEVVRQDIAQHEQALVDLRTPQTATAELARVRKELADLRERWNHIAAVALPPPLQGPVASGVGSSPAPTVAGEPTDRLPQSTRRIAPKYPEALREARIPGQVIFSVVVDRDGVMHDITVLEATHPEFAAAALEAVSQWQFDPGLKGGRPVNTRLKMPIVFNIDNPNWF